MKVFVNIVTWNGMKYLPEAFDSLAKQTFSDFTITVIDNGSIDGTVDYIRKNFSHFQLLRNVRNLGFARGHNQGIELARKGADAEDCFILLMNQDIVLEPTCLEILVKTLSQKKEIGVIGPKLLRAFWDLKTLGATSEVIRSQIIDSAGLSIKRTRRVIDRGAGEFDGEKYEKPGYVFGVSGALMMFRLSALEEAKGGNEYFDEDFFSYKEDVDLCWRLQNLGWRAYFEPNARAYHFRGAKGTGAFSLFRIFRERRKKSMLINFWSVRNHLLAIVKNDSLKNFFRNAWAIIPYEFAKFLYILIFEIDNLHAYGDFIKLLPRAIKKRKNTPNNEPLTKTMK